MLVMGVLRMGRWRRDMGLGDVCRYINSWSPKRLSVQSCIRSHLNDANDLLPGFGCRCATLEEIHFECRECL
jgi:hypothetical protein